MNITKEFLKKNDACTEGYLYVKEQGWLGLDAVTFLKNLMKHKRYDWANWLIVLTMERKQYLAYAIYAAEQVIDIYEKEYPYDDRPRKAIEAAKVVITNDTEETRAAAWAAWAAAWAAWAAAWAADAAGAAARAAAWAARVAAWDAARAAAWAARAAAWAAGDLGKEKMQIKILRYGIKLLEVE